MSLHAKLKNPLALGTEEAMEMQAPALWKKLFDGEVLEIERRENKIWGGIKIFFVGFTGVDDFMWESEIEYV